MEIVEAAPILKVPALQHEVWNDPMKGGTLVAELGIVALRQMHKVVLCTGQGIPKEPHGDAP